MRRKNIVEIMAMLQHLRAGASNNQIKKELKVSRHTARAYRQWAAENGLLEGALPPIEEVERLRAESFGQALPPQNISSVEPYRKFVLELYDQGVEMAAIYQRLDGQGFSGSYSAVYRFIRRERPKRPEVTVRVECQPGEEAQVDFGYAGYMLDPEKGKQRRSWAFVMTLSFSRHQYVEFVFDQKLATLRLRSGQALAATASEWAGLFRRRSAARRHRQSQGRDCQSVLGRPTAAVSLSGMRGTLRLSYRPLQTQNPTA